jgi:hypothetical protein
MEVRFNEEQVKLILSEVRAVVLEAIKYSGDVHQRKTIEDQFGELARKFGEEGHGG